MSEAPVEDCELDRRASTGLRLENADAAVFFFGLLLCPFFFSFFGVELPDSLELTPEVAVPLPFEPSSFLAVELSDFLVLAL
jgi:hypothetical protein